MGSLILPALDFRRNYLPMLVSRTCPYIAYTFISARIVGRTLITQKMLVSRITCLSKNNFFAQLQLEVMSWFCLPFILSSLYVINGSI